MLCTLNYPYLYAVIVKAHHKQDSRSKNLEGYFLCVLAVVPAMCAFSQVHLFQQSSFCDYYFFFFPQQLHFILPNNRKNTRFETQAIFFNMLCET